MLRAIFKKEVKLLLRASTGVVSMLVLSLACIFIFHFSMERNRQLNTEELSGLKWAIVFILSFIYIGQANWEEREGGAFRINSMFVNGQILYISRTILLWLVLTGIELIIILLFSFFFKNYFISNASLVKNFIFLLPGTLALVLLGNMLAAISFATRLKEVILPLLLIPFSFPIFLFGLEAEQKYTGIGKQGFYTSLGIMLAFIIFYYALGALFEELFQED